MVANPAEKNAGDVPAGKTAGARRMTVAVLEKELQGTRDELAHVKQAQAGIIAKLERLEENLANVAAPVRAARITPRWSLHGFVDWFAPRVMRLTALLDKFWPASKHRVYGTLIILDVLAWLLSWSGVSLFLFGVIMLVVFLESLKFAGMQFVYRYHDARRRLR
ncbi:MAG: hypothetical protein FD165_60 [Gammaproteobacteria bacterium]|nr:MAG: hypothetical protein FD165_60 [Gammaproteobacteria bacterium]TND06638.1 MAG: hypothetical protein FD120_370 [Gammaproteobacteria bacterium]